MNTKNDTISKSFTKEVVDTIDSFLHRGARSKFKTIVDVAKSMKMVWEQLQFPESEPVGMAWQKVGLDVLRRIIEGELNGFSAEEHLHGVNGMFNQTASKAVNVI